MQLVFATHNPHKFEEVVQLIPKGIELLSLDMIGCTAEIPETGSTLEENARIKADFVTKTYGLDCFSDDSGLLIETLDGKPGVYSARYAGPQKNSEDNMYKVLSELEGIENRSARFEAVIALHFQGKNQLFKGIVEGHITKEKKGTEGFGYDPIFIPEGYEKTFAQLSQDIKNQISHRARAVHQLITYLNEKVNKK